MSSNLGTEAGQLLPARKYYRRELLPREVNTHPPGVSILEVGNHPWWRAPQRLRQSSPRVSAVSARSNSLAVSPALALSPGCFHSSALPSLGMGGVAPPRADKAAKKT